ncbi:hypothetical protein F5Y19DRAFT_464403 [Xylariaceae sp. FL1651]|nr:hypothetical protein F5Y19DRAFT_464403 [Xylariaceae sp. FL1651]
MMNRFTVPFLLGFVKANLGLYDGPFGIDGSSIPDGLDAHSLNTIINAQQHPNATRGLIFKPLRFDGGTSGAIPKFGDIDSTAGFCLTMADFHDLPVNVTNAYTENGTNSASCVSTLEQACVNSILKSGSFRGNAAHEYTLGYTSMASRSFGLSTFSRGCFSSPQNSGKSNEYYTVMNRLQIVMMNVLFASSTGFEGGYSQNTQLLCMIVNAIKLRTDGTNGDGVTCEARYIRFINAINAFLVVKTTRYYNINRKNTMHYKS